MLAKAISHKELLSVFMKNKVLLALGANKEGVWGTPLEALEMSLQTFANDRIDVKRQSHWYETAPLGGNEQASYINGVVEVETHLPPLALLSYLKQIERKAGRRGGRKWGPRTLDLDILDYKGRVCGWDWQERRAGRTRPGKLILPHPEIQNRPFVLKPLIDIAPQWRHPVLRQTASQLYQILDNSLPGQVLRLI
jgi:2-amino-4-hydroxy-6-hydroxymethyldihydropteridine diphosphokinase